MLVAALAALVVAVILSWNDSGGIPSLPPPGPLQVPPLDESSRTVVELPMAPRDEISLGVFVPAQPESESLVLERVSLVGADETLTFVGALVSTGRANGAACVGASRTFPPRGCSTDAVEGWRISPEAVEDEGFQIVIGLTLEDPGVGGFALIAVRYSDPSTGESFRALFPQAGQLCAPRNEYEGRAGCPQTGVLLRTQKRFIEEQQ